MIHSVDLLLCFYVCCYFTFFPKLALLWNGMWVPCNQITLCIVKVGCELTVYTIRDFAHQWIWQQHAARDQRRRRWLRYNCEAEDVSAHFNCICWKIYRPVFLASVKRATNSLVSSHNVCISVLYTLQCFLFDDCVMALLFQLGFSCSAGSSTGHLVRLRSGVGYHHRVWNSEALWRCVPRCKMIP